MVKQKHITASQELRLKAVHLKQDHQDWSYSKIGKKIGCSTSLSADGWQDISRVKVSVTSKGQVDLSKQMLMHSSIFTWQ